METLHLVELWALWLCVSFTLTASFPDNPQVTYTYNRFPEIEKQCGFVLSSASELEYDDSRGQRLKDELSFLIGDWDQDSGGEDSLMPFDDSDLPESPSSFLKLVSFWVKDIDPVRRSKHMVGVTGMLEIGISRDSVFAYRPYKMSPSFHMEPGTSRLSVLFEGAYLELENEEQRVLCLLGTSLMPTRSHYQKPDLVQDDQVMLVLRYPKTFSLTTRGVIGEMRSLNPKPHPAYFDQVSISSQLGYFSQYHYGSAELISKTCAQYKGEDMTSQGYEYFTVLDNLARNEYLTFVPNRERNDAVSNLGPFKVAEGNSGNFRLLIQDVQADAANDLDNLSTGEVSAVFRVLDSWEDPYRSGDRTGLSSMTLSAEGKWVSGGQLCMVGCVGLLGEASDRCNSRVLVYFPSTFSITQRSVMRVTITIMNEAESDSPVMFELVLHPKDLFHKYGWIGRFHSKYWTYHYTKIVQASALWDRNKPSMFGAILKKLFLYPYFSSLSEELSTDIYAAQDGDSIAQERLVHVKIEVLSLGSIVGDQTHPKAERPFVGNPKTLEISGHISVTGQHFHNISLSFEGLYDKTVGEMFLVCCRDVRGYQKVMQNGTHLENGMDCLIEAKIQYPPKNTRWLKNPKVKILVISKRSEQDSLHFSPISLKTFPISYGNKTADIAFRDTFERALRILVLASAISCTASQLRLNSAYISLVMLAVQALGYSIPLIFTARDKYSQRCHVLDCAIRILNLVALLLTLRLYQKVRESRTKQKTRIPTEKKVLFTTSAIHFTCLLIINQLCNTLSEPPLRYGGNISKNTKKLIQWLGFADEYTNLVQDLFLLPQIVGNFVWQVQGQPLRKLYYVGLTIGKLLFHAYDYIKDTLVVDQEGDKNIQTMSVDSHEDSKICNIVISIALVVLAVIVHLQLKKSHNQKLKIKKKPMRIEDMDSKSELDQRLLL